ncbi:MAG: hypothetical protein QM786_17985 [Breznakibacter sp.]
MSRLIVLLFLLVYSVHSYAQNMHTPKISSPQAASMDSHGEFGVDMFVGRPNISIPVYNVSIGRINMPISLDYNSASVQPNAHPTWVGLGWNLNCGGVISRKMKDLPDEYTSNTDNMYGYIERGVHDAITGNLQYYDRSSNLYRDLQADEFSFSFPGYSGRLFYTPQGWQVLDTSEDIKVELLSYYNLIYNNIGAVRQRLGHSEATMLGDRFIYGFVLTTADGTSFKFGGSLQAIEFGNSFSANYDMYYFPKDVCADAWYLTEIKDVDGNMVLFGYNAGDPICHVAPSFFNISGVSYSNSSSIGHIEGRDGSYSPKRFDPYRKEGRLIFPVYPTNLTSGYYDVYFRDLDYIQFVRSTTPSMGYSKKYLEKKEDGGPDNGLTTCWIRSADKFKWYQLDAIAICPQTRYNSTIYRLIHKPEEGNQNEHRLALHSLIKLGGNAWEGFDPTQITNWDNYEHLGRYDFKYNDLDIGLMGQLSADRWGFYRANPTNGLLQKIVYPTGGYSEFKWERHDCAKYVAPNKASLNYVPGSMHDSFGSFQEFGTGVLFSDFGYVQHISFDWNIEASMSNIMLTGGARIKSIKSYDRNHTLLKSNTYKYLDASKRSSGVLNGHLEEVYKSSIRSTGENSFGRITVDVDLESFNGLTKYSYNGRSHVGYSRVVEKDDLKGIERVYEFVNYGDVFDAKPFRSGNNAYENLMFVETIPPYQQLGKLKSLTEVGESYVRKKRFEYRMIGTGNSGAPKVTRLSDGFTCESGVFLYGNNGSVIPFSITFVSYTMFDEYDLRYKLVLEEEKMYHPSSEDILFSKQTAYTYNDQGLLAESKSTTGPDESITTSYLYPCDNTDLSVHSSMKNKHIYTPWFFSKTEHKKGAVSKITEATYHEYDEKANYKPKAVYSLNNRNLSGLNISDFQIENIDGVASRYNVGRYLIKDADFEFDKNGRLYKYKPLGGPVEYYVWGNLKNLPIARIIAEKEVAYDPNSTSDDDEKISELTEAIKAKNIRYLAEKYTVSHFEGITGVIKPNGQALKYKFDNAGRLNEVIDQDMSTLEKYEYGIVNY